MSPELFEQQVRTSLDRSVVAFNEGREEFFEDFAKDAMIFTVDSTEPIKGRETYRQNYLPALASQKREKTVLDRSVQIVGDKAVVTQTARIAQADNVATVRQTIVYGDTPEGLKVLHSHTSLVSPTGPDNGSWPIRVVNERIATVSSSLGVAQ